MNSLSILIPIYNFDCCELVRKLHDQCEQLGVDYEIICIDDASSLYKSNNESINNLSNTQLIELETNIGRSKIRNLLAQNAKKEYLLFMDCDSMVDDGFIVKYAKNSEDIVVGGRLYLDTPPSEHKYYFHWKYGTLKEPKPADATKHFTSNNFLIKRTIFEAIRFDETIKGYGHEDTIFGLNIKKNNIKIRYIHNPVYHIGLSTNKQFLSNSKNAIQNLNCIGICNAEEVKIVKYHKRIINLRLNSLLSFIYRQFGNAMENNLLGKEPNMFVFNLYKLCYLCNLKNKKEI